MTGKVQEDTLEHSEGLPCQCCVDIGALSGGGVPEADVGGIAERAMQAEVRKNMTNPWTLKAGAVGQSR